MMKLFDVEFDVHDCRYILNDIQAESERKAKYAAYKKWLEFCDEKGFSEPSFIEFVERAKAWEHK